MIKAPAFQLSSRARVLFYVLAALGAGTAVLGLSIAPERTWPNLVLDGFYLSSLGVSAIFFIATQRATGARWSASLRRVPEALMALVPVGAILTIPVVFFGRQILYPWSRPEFAAHPPANSGSVQYLQQPWVYTRLIMVFAAWLLFAWLFRRASLQQDQQPELSLTIHQRLTRYAIIFIPVFAVTLSVAAFDWLISVDPRWFSTMYAVYIFAGTFVQGIAAVTLAVVMLKERGPMAEAVSEHQLHDLGKMLFAFTTFWAYIWTAQYLLIWYGNIPEEVTHYVTRTNGPWLYLFALNLIANWVVPFLVLLSVKTKCTTRILKAMCVLLLCGHWLDLYLQLAPAVWNRPRVGVPEVLIAAGFVGVICLVFVRTLNKAPLVPVNDPILAYEQTHLHVQHEPVHRKLRGAEQ